MDNIIYRYIKYFKIWNTRLGFNKCSRCQKFPTLKFWKKEPLGNDLSYSINCECEIIYGIERMALINATYLYNNLKHTINLFNNRGNIPCR